MVIGQHGLTRVTYKDIDYPFRKRVAADGQRLSDPTESQEKLREQTQKAISVAQEKYEDYVTYSTYGGKARQAAQLATGDDRRGSDPRPSVDPDTRAIYKEDYVEAGTIADKQVAQWMLKNSSADSLNRQYASFSIDERKPLYRKGLTKAAEYDEKAQSHSAETHQKWGWEKISELWSHIAHKNRSSKLTRQRLKQSISRTSSLRSVESNRSLSSVTTQGSITPERSRHIPLTVRTSFPQEKSDAGPSSPRPRRARSASTGSDSSTTRQMTQSLGDIRLGQHRAKEKARLKKTDI